MTGFFRGGGSFAGILSLCHTFQYYPLVKDYVSRCVRVEGFCSLNVKGFWKVWFTETPKPQNPLIKEYTFNLIWVPVIVYGIFLE